MPLEEAQSAFLKAKKAEPIQSDTKGKPPRGHATTEEKAKGQGKNIIEKSP
jgi:hypothetical protein